MHQAKDATISRHTVHSYRSDQTDSQCPADNRKQTSKSPNVGIFQTLYVKFRDWVSSPRGLSARSSQFESRSNGGATETGHRQQSSLDAGVKSRRPLQSIVPPCCDVVTTDDDCFVDSLSPVTMAAGLPLSLSCGHVHRAIESTAVLNCVVPDHSSSTSQQLFYATWPMWSSKYCPRGQ